MAIWYMVQRLDDGTINGHNTWRYSPVSSAMVDIGEVRAQRHGDGTAHHLEVYVDAATEDQAVIIARSAFDNWRFQRQGEAWMELLECAWMLSDGREA